MTTQVEGPGGRWYEAARIFDSQLHSVCQGLTRHCYDWFISSNFVHVPVYLLNCMILGDLLSVQAAQRIVLFEIDIR